MTRYKISVYSGIYQDIKIKVRFFEIKNVVLTTFYNQQIYKNNITQSYKNYTNYSNCIINNNKLHIISR